MANVFNSNSDNQMNAYLSKRDRSYDTETLTERMMLLGRLARTGKLPQSATQCSIEKISNMSPAEFDAWLGPIDDLLSNQSPDDDLEALLSSLGASQKGIQRTTSAPSGETQYVDRGTGSTGRFLDQSELNESQRTPGPLFQDQQPETAAEQERREIEEFFKGRQ